MTSTGPRASTWNECATVNFAPTGSSSPVSQSFCMDNLSASPSVVTGPKYATAGLLIDVFLLLQSRRQLGERGTNLFQAPGARLRAHQHGDIRRNFVLPDGRRRRYRSGLARQFTRDLREGQPFRLQAFNSLNRLPMRFAIDRPTPAFQRRRDQSPRYIKANRTGRQARFFREFCQRPFPRRSRHAGSVWSEIVTVSSTVW